MSKNISIKLNLKGLVTDAITAVGKGLIYASGNKSEVLTRVEPKEAGITKENWIQEINTLDNQTLIGKINGVMGSWHGYLEGHESIAPYERFDINFKTFNDLYNSIISGHLRNLTDHSTKSKLKIGIWRNETLEKREYNLYRRLDVYDKMPSGRVYYSKSSSESNWAKFSFLRKLK